VIKCVYDNAHMTVKEIAKMAGVSIGTVDRVLHGRNRVAPETRERIEAIVRKAGFAPDPIARHLKRNRTYLFAALVPKRNEDSGYWNLAAEGIEAAAAEIKSFKARFAVEEFDRYDRTSFIAAAERVSAARPDGVLLAPVLPEEARKFTGGLDIPYAYFDASLPGTSPLVAIGQDAFRGGVLAARLTSLFSESSGPLGVVVVHGEDYHISRRRDGFLSAVSRTGRRTTVAECGSLEDDSAAERTLESLLRREPRTAGLFVTNASAHRLAAAASGIRQKRGFAVVGYDLVPENERMLRSGGLDAIISQNPSLQAKHGILALYRSLVLRQAVETRIEMPLEIFVKENLPPDPGE